MAKILKFIEAIWLQSLSIFHCLSLSISLFALFLYILLSLSLYIYIYTCISTIRINLCVRTCGLLSSISILFSAYLEPIWNNINHNVAIGLKTMWQLKCVMTGESPPSFPRSLLHGFTVYRTIFTLCVCVYTKHMDCYPWVWLSPFPPIHTHLDRINLKRLIYFSSSKNKYENVNNHPFRNLVFRPFRPSVSSVLQINNSCFGTRMNHIPFPELSVLHLLSYSKQIIDFKGNLQTRWQ